MLAHKTILVYVLATILSVIGCVTLGGSSIQLGNPRKAMVEEQV